MLLRQAGLPVFRTEVEAFEGRYPRRVDAFYDARGRLACESAPYHSDETPHYTRYGYDVRDRLTSVIRPDGGSTAIAYAAVAASHRVKATVTETVKKENGTESDKRQSVRLYNILGELVEATDGSDKASMEQVTTTYEIDTSGLLKTVTADGVATSFEYDAAGNRTSVTNPDMGTAAGGKSVKFEYTGLGQVRERTDGRGTTTYAYDLLGRPTSRVDPAGMGTVTATWSYDTADNGKGRLASRSYGGAAFRETYEYNDQARLKKMETSISGTTGPFVTRHAYDGLGRPSTTTYPSGLKVKRGYNARGYLETLADVTTATTKTLVTYGAMDAYGNIETESFGNGAETTRMFDPKSGPADVHQDRARHVDLPGPRLRVADGRLAREPHREGGGNRDVGAGAQEGGVRLRPPGPARQRGDEAGRVHVGERTLDYAYDPNGT